MELKQIDLEALIDEITNQYRERKPTLAEIQVIARTVTAAIGLGVGEAIALAALLLGLLNRYYPRTDKSIAVCERIYQGNKCGKRFVKSEKTDEYITLWCIKKHETKLRIK